MHIVCTHVSWIHMYTLCMYTCPLPQKKIQHICDGIRQVAGETPASRKGSATDRRTPGDPKKKTEVAKHWGWIQLDIYCD